MLKPLKTFSLVKRRYEMRDKLRKNLATLRQQDPESNTHSTPPPDEKVRLVCLWAMEYYSPTHTGDLITGLRKLGWDDFFDPTLNLIQMREHHSGGSMTSLGHLVRKESRRFPLTMTRIAPLPKSVDYAIAHLFSLTPELNCVVVCFVFRKDTATRFDRALRAKHCTEVEREKAGWKFLRPDHQKEREIGRIRQELSNTAMDWFQKHLPGLCASGLLDGEMPTCEGITTRVAEPFPPSSEHTKEAFPYTSIVGIGQYARDFDVWRRRDTPTLKMGFPSGLAEDHGLRHHAILATKEPLPSWAEHYDQPQEGEEVAHTHGLVSPWLVMWGVIPILKGYVRLIKDVRDSSALRDANRSDAAATLKKLRRYVAYNFDMADVASDLLLEQVSHNPWARSDPFESCNNDKRSLLAFLLKQIEPRVAWVQDREKSLRDHIAQIGSLLGTEENIRTQAKMRKMTWWLLTLTVLALLLAGLSLAVNFFGFLTDVGGLSGV
ncbi:MAG: hypothetical protein OXS33_02300 [bacterium]|nr:hypothetical protein [bacterium]